MEILLAVQDQDSLINLKAVCWSMGCKVFEAANTNDVILNLQNENIDLAFFDLSSMFSVSIDLVSFINSPLKEYPVILISEQVNQIEEINLNTGKIFYNIQKPFNSVEIEQVIKTFKSVIPENHLEKEHLLEPLISDESFTKKNHKDNLRSMTFRSRFIVSLMKVPSFDRRITRSIRRISLRYFDSPISVLARPARNVDYFLTKLARGVF